MQKGNTSGVLILVVQDVEETRDGIEALLLADGYRVDTARDEKDAVMRAQRRYPDCPVNLGQVAVEVIAAARRIRARAELSEACRSLSFGRTESVKAMSRSDRRFMSPIRITSTN